MEIKNSEEILKETQNIITTGIFESISNNDILISIYELINSNIEEDLGLDDFD